MIVLNILAVLMIVGTGYAALCFIGALVNRRPR